MLNFWYGLLLFGVTITGGLLGIIITLGYGILQIFPLYKKKQWYMTCMIIPAILGVSMIYSLIPTEKMGSMENRMIIWKTSIQMVSISPERLFFGYGLEQFKNQFPLFVDGKNAQYFTNNTPDRAHNIFLDILFSFGLFGLSFCIIFLV
jgi:O-antigen ligase